MMFFMLTNMIESNSMLIAIGSGAGELIRSAFDAPMLEKNVYELEGVVSRKKQLIPEILNILTQ